MLAVHPTTPCALSPHTRHPRNAASGRRRRWSTAAASSGKALTSGDNPSQLQTTITNIDLLLGAQVSTEHEQPSSAPAERPAAEAAAAAAPAAVVTPPEWANLPAQEVSRRQVLVQRRAMLGLRQAELQRECDVQERKVVAAGQRLAALQLQLRQLSAQQRELGDLIDPEAAALRQQAQAAAEERAEREGRRDVFILLGCIVGLYGLAATSLAKQVADRKRQMRDRCFLD